MAYSLLRISEFSTSINNMEQEILRTNQGGGGTNIGRNGGGCNVGSNSDESDGIHCCNCSSMFLSILPITYYSSSWYSNFLVQ